MKKKLLLTFLFIYSLLPAQAQQDDKKTAWPFILKGGIRIQKTQKLYWENGFAFDFTSPKIVHNRVHLGMSYVSSRLGSALGTNAIGQDNILLNGAYHFRYKKPLQPFVRLNMGYFHASYESEIFDVLPNNSFLLSADGGLSYAFKFPITVNLTTGYNLITGDGSSGPGTLYPVYYQMSVLYTLLKK